MASSLEHPDKTQATESTRLDFLVRNRKQSAYVFFALGVLFAGIALWLGIRYRAEYFALCFGLAWLALVNLCAGIYQLLREPDRIPEPDATRMLVLAVAGLSGFVITLVGVMLAYQWWDVYLDWFKGEPGEQAWRMWASVIAFFGGLAIMFWGLQLARTEERSNFVLRRLLYGYNTFLTAVLLLAILAVCNVLAYAKFSAPIDFTASTMYTLSSRSKSILHGLEKPTKIYVIMPENYLLLLEMQTLLNNCREVNDKIEVRYLSPDLNDQEVRELERTYGVAAREGVLIVYGTGAEADHRFINAEDLYSGGEMGSRGIQFKGEDAVMTALNAMEEGKTKPIVYITQGHGELDLNDMDETRPDRGVGVLKSRLEKRNYEVKPLVFKPANPQVPDDAALVMIPGPKEPFSGAIVNALRDYMNPEDPKKKKGKLLVFMDVALSPESTMVQTGLEPLLAQYNVLVGNSRILNLRIQNPLQELAVVNPALADRNPIASTFQDHQFLLYNVRPVQTQEKPPTNPTERSLTADQLLLIPAGLLIWAEPNLQANATELAAALRKNPQDLEKRVSEQPLCAAAAVTESAPSNDPHAFMRKPEEASPRLIVFGTTSPVTNRSTSERRGGLAYELVANCIDWLREKPQSIGIEAKNRNMYSLDAESIHAGRLILLPFSLMSLAVVGLGVGVWLVRRQ